MVVIAICVCFTWGDFVVKRCMLGLSVILFLMGCGGDEKADKLHFMQLDQFGNSQALSVQKEEFITEVEELVEGLKWQEMKGEIQETIYTFHLKHNGDTIASYTLWRDPEVNKVKLFDERTDSFANLSQEELRTLQEIRGIGEENYYKDQVGEWSD